MTFPLQNPDATQVLVDLYDIKAQLSLVLDKVVSPVAIVDDGWARATYHAFNELVPASTAVHNSVILAPDPNAQQKLMYVQYVGTGNLVATVDIRASVLDTLTTAFDSIDYDQFTLDGVADPEEVFSREILGDAMPVHIPGGSFVFRVPATGVGETLQLSAIVATIPRRMQPY